LRTAQLHSSVEYAENYERAADLDTEFNTSPLPFLDEAEMEKFSRVVTANGFRANIVQSMTDSLRTGESGPELDKGKTVESSGKVGPPRLPPGSDADATNAGAPVTSNKLTPEEQMALFEKELKENDWGHQPC
jgi:hypothetical protein